MYIYTKTTIHCQISFIHNYICTAHIVCVYVILITVSQNPHELTKAALDIILTFYYPCKF